MKKHILSVSCLMLAVAGVASAQTPTKVGVINIQSAIVSTKDGQKAVADLETRMEPRKKDLEKKQSDIRDLQEKLQRGGNAMADAAKNLLTRDIDTKTKNYNRDMQDAVDENETEQRKLLDELGGKMMQVIDKYALANGYAVILDVSNPNTPVLYVSNQVEITKEIIDLYDKQSPTTTAAPKPNTSAPKPSGAAAAPPASAPKPAAPPVTKKQP